MRPIISLFSRSVAALFLLVVAVVSVDPVAEAAVDSGVYVEFRESDSADAPVVERWRLYGSSYALVIGIDNYTNGWPRLSNAVKDARLVAAELGRKGFEVELLTDVSGAQLREGLRRFFAIKGDDPASRLFVWFAGHGHTENGEGYLVPADAPIPGAAEFRLIALHLGDVGSMVKIARSKHVLAVFDSCFAGTVFQSQRARPPAAITAAVKRPVRQFLTSGDADQLVSDDGTFRTLFLRALAGEEGADANDDGYLTGTELSLYLEDRIINLTQGRQTPRSGKLRDPRFDQGDFVFVLPQVAAASAVTAVSQAPSSAAVPIISTESSRALLEMTFWQTIQNSERASDYQAYLHRYPDGAFAELARNRMLELGQGSAGESEQQVVIATPEPAPTENAPVVPETRTAALSAGHFDGRWWGGGKTSAGSSRAKCGSGPIIKLAIKGSKISGEIKLIVASYFGETLFARYSGTIDDEGNFKGKGHGLKIDGSLGADGNTVSGTWKFTQKVCRGTFELTRTDDY